MPNDIPPPLHLSFDPAPSPDIRGTLGQEINDFHARTVPRDSNRFAILLHDQSNTMVAGLSGLNTWQWLFIEALWVSDAWRNHGLGRALLSRAEAHAKEQGCHSAWLDTFQAEDFYLAQGYQTFGELEDYPPGQTRHFMRKSLVV